jgi:hypothetical protein
MHRETKYRALRFLGWVHSVIGGVVFGLAIVAGSFTGLAGVFGAAHYGITGERFIPGSEVVVAAGIAGTLIIALAGAFILALGEAFRALADIADNSSSLLSALAAPGGEAVSGSGVDAPRVEGAPPGPMDL